MNGSHYWELNKRRKIKMKIAEMWMLKQICVVSRLGILRDELESKSLVEIQDRVGKVIKIIQICLEKVNNNDIVKKIDEIRVEKNQGQDRLKNKINGGY